MKTSLFHFFRLCLYVKLIGLLRVDTGIVHHYNFFVKKKKRKEKKGNKDFSEGTFISVFAAVLYDKIRHFKAFVWENSTVLHVFLDWLQYALLWKHECVSVKVTMY